MLYVTTESSPTSTWLVVLSMSSSGLLGTGKVFVTIVQTLLDGVGVHIGALHIFLQIEM